MLIYITFGLIEAFIQCANSSNRAAENVVFLKSQYLHGYNQEQFLFPARNKGKKMNFNYGNNHIQSE